MGRAENGHTVKVHYTGKLDDGKVFDSSESRGPLEFKLGEGQVIKGFEEAVNGMETGEKKTVRLAPEQAYGARRQDLVLDVARTSIPSQLDPQIGQRLQGKSHDGQTVEFTVVGITDTAIKVDANHPLAGENLTFDIELVEAG